MRWNNGWKDASLWFASALILTVCALTAGGMSAMSADDGSPAEIGRTLRGDSIGSRGAITVERGERGASLEEPGAERQIETEVPTEQSTSEPPRPRSRARFPERAPSLPSVRALTTDYGPDGSAAHALRSGLARPTALASGDFDRDGVADLICGYATADGGLVTFHAGNIDAIFPYSPDARLRRQQGTFSEEAFLAAARAIELPVRPEFLAAGDFDGDDLWDVVIADEIQPAVYLLAGDGSGGFAPAVRVKLPGRVTALAAGEINRADGLLDLAIGLAGEAGPELLVFEGPQGALRSEPEVLPLHAAPTALLLGRFYGGPWHDVAVAAGSDLILLQGRDRRLVLDERERATVEPAVVERIEMPSAIEAVAWGDFAWESFETRELALLLEDGTLRLLSRDAVNGWTTVGRREVASSAVGDPAAGPARSALLPVQFSGLPTTDLAVLAGSVGQLQILTGMVRRGAGAEGEAERLVSSGTLVALETADPPIAMLPMRLNADALSDLVLLLPGGEEPFVAATAPLATLTVDSTADNTTAGDGSCTLREAIINSNTDSDTTSGDCAAGSGVDTIEFNIGGGGAPAVIAPLSALPAITDAVTIDGTTQGCVSPPCVVLNGVGAGFVAAGLHVTAGSSTLRGLVIQQFIGEAGNLALNGHGIYLTSSGNVLEGNNCGTDVTGALGRGNDGAGVRIEDGSNNTIGGTVLGAGNVLSASVHGDGIHIHANSNDNQVLGNFVGTNVDGTAPLGNTDRGVHVLGSGTVVGGASAGAGNLISSNGNRGVDLGANSTASQVLGNFIGTDVTGTVGLGNTGSGVRINDASNNTIGGTTTGARNIISGNEADGVFIVNLASQGNFVLGNYIGTDVTGTAELSNTLQGVLIFNASNNTLGGTAEGAGNLISGNGTDGVFILGAASQDNVVLGNFIGTDVSGTADLGNLFVGVEIESGSNNTIGGTSDGARNIISGNDQGGVLLQLATQNSVLGNFIGTDVSGTADLGNLFYGVGILDGSNNTVGGTAAGAGNLISGNDWGVALDSTSGNKVIGNFIGTQVDGTSPLGNELHGVLLEDGANNNTIGGTGVTPGRCDGPCNRIGYSVSPGNDGVRVLVGAGNGNAILGNSIFSCAELGIDLEAPGITPNDPMDPDTGANGEQNFPVLSLAEATPAGLTVSGTLNSRPGLQYRLEFYGSPSCDGSGHGEGATYLGFRVLTTDGSGNASFAVPALAGVSNGDAVTATATAIFFGLPKDTSEFSGCVEATCLALASFGQTVTAPDRSSLAWTLPDDVQFVKGPLAGVGVYAITETGELPEATSLDIASDVSGPGGGFYYLVRPLACGSWQTNLGEQPERDVALP